MIALITISTMRDLSLVHNQLEHCYNPDAAYVALVTYQEDQLAHSLVYVAAAWATIREELFVTMPVVLSLSYAYPEEIRYLSAQ